MELIISPPTTAALLKALRRLQQSNVSTPLMAELQAAINNNLEPSEVIALKVDAMLNLLGQRTAEGEFDPVLATNGGFAPAMMAEFLARFPLTYRTLQPFMDGVLEDLRHALRHNYHLGSVMCGTYVLEHDNRIVYKPALC